MRLNDVSKRRLRKNGFLESSVIINKDMLLLFKIDKDVLLDNHHHPHTQLGYCINGEFDFDVEGNHYSVTEGHSYLLKDRVYHSAVATTEYYAMDIKIILDSDSLPDRIRHDVYKNELETEFYTLKKAEIGNCVVQKLSFIKKDNVHIKLDLKKQLYIVVSKSCLLKIDNTEIQCEPMAIYFFEPDSELVSFSMDNNMEIILVSY